MGVIVMKQRSAEPGVCVANIRINDRVGLMQVDFIVAEMQRHAAFAEQSALHAEETLIKIASPPDIDDR